MNLDKAASLLILVLSLAGLVFRVATTRRADAGPGSLSVLSVRRQREIRKAARQFFAEGGWTLAGEPADSIVFTYQLGPRGPLLVLLLLLGVLPGLLALALGRKRLTVTVATHEDAGGSATVVTWSAAAAEPPCRDFALMVRDQEPSPRRTRLPRGAAPPSPRRRRRRSDDATRVTGELPPAL
jgi:hypothetical protein